jgi:hypothetical protein
MESRQPIKPCSNEAEPYGWIWGAYFAWRFPMPHLRCEWCRWMSLPTRLCPLRCGHEQAAVLAPSHWPISAHSSGDRGSVWASERIHDARLLSTTRHHTTQTLSLRDDGGGGSISVCSGHLAQQGPLRVVCYVL